MGVTKKTTAPFGVRVKRFTPLGYHPSLETRPGTYKSNYLFPGCYEWAKPPKIVSKIPR